MILRKTARRASLYLGFLVFLLIALFPFYWMVATSFKSPNEILSTPPTYIPGDLSLRTFSELFLRRNFGAYMINSIVVTCFATVFSVTISAFAAYGFARFRFPGRGLLMGTVVISAMLPFITVLGPTYLIVEGLGLLDTKLGLILVFIGGGIPLAIWFLYVFYQTIPVELEEAAMVDGANRIQAFLRVTLPLSAPGLAASTLLLLIWFWNEFIFALVLTLSPQSKTLTVGLTEIPGLWDIPYDYMSAGGTVAALPVILLVIFFQRYIIKGIVAGAVKE
jgi:ABC-type glycerol-3-phosphate transport system permease component